MSESVRLTALVYPHGTSLGWGRHVFSCSPIIRSFFRLMLTLVIQPVMMLSAAKPTRTSTDDISCPIASHTGKGHFTFRPFKRTLLVRLVSISEDADGRHMCATQSRNGSGHENG